MCETSEVLRKTILPQGPFSSCSGDFDHITRVFQVVHVQISLCAHFRKQAIWGFFIAESLMRKLVPHCCLFVFCFVSLTLLKSNSSVLYMHTPIERTSNINTIHKSTTAKQHQHLSVVIVF